MNNNYHEYYDNDEAIEAIYYYFELIKEKQAEIEPIEDQIDELQQIIDGKNHRINEIIESIFDITEDFEISDEKLREIEKEMDYKL